jgi:hypothetical protein
MPSLFVARAELDALSQSPVLFDALIAEDDAGATFQKTLTRDDPGVAAQRVTARWPHHLPGELIIALTGQAAVIATRRKGLIGENWRGHGVRIREARFRAPVLLGEIFYTRVEVVRTHKLGDSMHVSFRFRMWKHTDDGREIETFRSEQDAMFSPG